MVSGFRQDVPCLEWDGVVRADSSADAGHGSSRAPARPGDLTQWQRKGGSRRRQKRRSTRILLVDSNSAVVEQLSCGNSRATSGSVSPGPIVLGAARVGRRVNLERWE
ncbi:hypothetical protein GCM10023318_36640 [Nocardia callitridis]|uniref:Uncharacterized protein n=1 Tax=Nocardia callitridis TaxID=648753 RepID=A0ABP9KGF5_9NOCA